MQKILRVLVALILGPVAFLTLLRVSDSHVTMCMLGAITISVGFIWTVLSISEKAKHLVSFAAGWILFYTIITASTLLIFGWLIGQSNVGPLNLLNGVFWYHFLINFVILLVFWSKIEKLSTLALGFIMAGLLSPLMFAQAPFGRQPMEPVSFIAFYFLVSLILFFFYLRFRAVLAQSIKFKKFLVRILRAYVVVLALMMVATYVKI